MGSLFFVVKTFGLSLVIVMLLQIRWGEHTMDEMFYQSMKNSSLLSPVHEAASGGVLWVKGSFQKVTAMFSTKLKDQIQQTNAPGNRRFIPEIKRHTAEAVDTAKEGSERARSRFRQWVNDSDVDTEQEPSKASDTYY